MTIFKRHASIIFTCMPFIFMLIGIYDTMNDNIFEATLLYLCLSKYKNIINYGEK